MFFLFVAGAGLMVWLMPYLAPFEASALDISNSVMNDCNSILEAIWAFADQIEVFVSSAITCAAPILIQGAILAIQIILALFFLGVGAVLLICIGERMKRGTVKQERKTRPATREISPMSKLHWQQLKEANEAHWHSNWEWEQERPQRLAKAMKLVRKANKEGKRLAKAKKKEDDENWRQAKIWADYRREREKLLARDYIRDNQLSKDEKDAIHARGYQELKTSPWGDTGAIRYWVKPQESGGAEHWFFCYLIRDLVQERLKEKIVCSPQRGADMVFSWKGKKYAIDVETGTNLEKHKAYVVDRYAPGAAYGKDYDVLYIFVTSKRLKRKYARFGRVITRGTVRKAVGEIFGK